MCVCVCVCVCMLVILLPSRNGGDHIGYKMELTGSSVIFALIWQPNVDCSCHFCNEYFWYFVFTDVLFSTGTASDKTEAVPWLF